MNPPPLVLARAFLDDARSGRSRGGAQAALAALDPAGLAAGLPDDPSPTALLAAGVLAWPDVVAAAGLSAVPLLVVGLAWYTRRESPLPTVAAMIWLVLAQLGAWALVAQG